MVAGIQPLMRTRLIVCSGLLCLVSLVVTAQAPTRTAAEIAKLGPQVGQRVPEFSLVDQSGRTRTLASILGPNGALLVFFRSASW
jgi:hypothetical protein